MLGLKDNTTGNQEPTSEVSADRFRGRKFEATTACQGHGPVEAGPIGTRHRFDRDQGSVAASPPRSNHTQTDCYRSHAPRRGYRRNTNRRAIEIAFTAQAASSKISGFERARSRLPWVATKFIANVMRCPTKDGLGLDEMVRRAAEKTLSYPLENALVDYQPVGADRGTARRRRSFGSALRLSRWNGCVRPLC